MKKKMPKRRKYNIGIFESSDSTETELSDDMWFAKICELNRYIDSRSTIDEIKRNKIELPPNVFHHWLWKSPPCERPHGQCLLNLNHLIGLFITRYTAIYSEIDEEIKCELIETPVKFFTLRQLRDTVHYLQCEFNKRDAAKDPETKRLLNACMHRFGTLTMTGGGEDVMDELSCVDTVMGTPNHLKINLVSLRRFLCIFLILHRHIYVCERAKEIPSFDDREDVKIFPHHITGSDDVFIELSYHFSLMPAAKLNYMHEFGQMFHNVSQVAYFHNPSFRLPTKVHEPEKINSGELEYIHIIPPFLQLYPQLQILYEETDKDLTGRLGNFYLFHMGQKIYLIDPKGCFFKCHHNTMQLLKYYVSTIP